MDGLIVVDKPAGPTSHDIVDEVRRLTGIRRVGHTGTLDPFATGVLPLCLGRATRLSRFLMRSRKVYEATMKLGVSTDTYDLTGRVTAERALGTLRADEVEDAARRFVGEIRQVPPPYSARRAAGRRLHERARAGEMVHLPPAVVTIHRLEIVEVDLPLVRFITETSSGTYIRSLGHDLGEALGCGAHLTQLRRTASGDLSLERAHTPDDLRMAASGGALHRLVIPMEAVDLGLPTVVVTAEGASAMSSGRRLLPGHVKSPPPSGAPGDGLLRVVDPSGNLIGVALSGLEPSVTGCLLPRVVLTGEHSG